MLEKTHALIEQYEQELTDLFEKKKKHLQLLTALIVNNKDIAGCDIATIINMTDKEVDEIFEQIKKTQEELQDKIEKEGQSESAVHS